MFITVEKQQLQGWKRSSMTESASKRLQSIFAGIRSPGCPVCFCWLQSPSLPVWMCRRQTEECQYDPGCLIEMAFSVLLLNKSWPSCPHNPVLCLLDGDDAGRIMGTIGRLIHFSISADNRADWRRCDIDWIIDSGLQSREKRSKGEQPCVAIGNVSF